MTAEQGGVHHLGQLAAVGYKRCEELILGAHNGRHEVVVHFDVGRKLHTRARSMSKDGAHSCLGLRGH